MTDSLAFNEHIASHFLNQVLTDTQPQSCSLLVKALFVGKLAEIEKQFALVFFGDAPSRILDSYLE